MSHWINAVDGNFNNANDWKPHRVPVHNRRHQDNAVLDAVGGDYTVTANHNEHVVSLQTASNATLSITGAHVFKVDDGTGRGANAGSIVIGDGSTLQLAGGPVRNTGQISLNAGANNAFIDIFGDTTLSGGGAVVLSDSAFNGIVDRFMGFDATLTNVDNTISGAGVIGSGGIVGGGTLTVVNGAGGVIDATGATSALILNTPGATFTNDGLIEATGLAGLDIASTTVDGSGGGVIRAGDNSIVRLLEATLVGGTLKSFGSGGILASGQTTFDGQASILNNQGKVFVDDNSFLVARGVIDNSGSISLLGNAAGSMITLSGDLTLTGGGTVSLGDFAGNSVGADAFTDTLTNVDNTITGDGQLGLGQLKLVNQAGGVIEETGATGLVIDTGSNTIINAGLIEDIGAGGVTIQSAVTNTGVIKVDGAAIGQNTVLAIDATVKNNGMLVVNGGQLIVYEAVTGSGSAKINGGGLLKFGASFNQDVAFTDSAGLLELAQSQSYAGTVSGIATQGQGDILDLDDIAFVDAGEVTYVDNGSHTGGVLTVTDGTHTAHITLAGHYASSRFSAFSDGHGGVDVFYMDKPAAARTPAPDRFAAAMAGFGADHGGPAHVADDAPYTRPAPLAVPRMAMA